VDDAADYELKPQLTRTLPSDKRASSLCVDQSINASSILSYHAIPCRVCASLQPWKV
jgi:hypothetical protein